MLYWRINWNWIIIFFYSNLVKSRKRGHVVNVEFHPIPIHSIIQFLSHQVWACYCKVWGMEISLQGGKPLFCFRLRARVIFCITNHLWYFVFYVSTSLKLFLYKKGVFSSHLCKSPLLLHYKWHLKQLDPSLTYWSTLAAIWLIIWRLSNSWPLFVWGSG